MPPTERDQITGLLLEASAGNTDALHQLLPLVYQELRGLAERALRGERPGQTLGATAIVHEVYLRMVDQNRTHWQHRGQFFSVAAQMMRRILVDHARGREAAKRGGAWRRVAEDGEGLAAKGPSVDLMELDEALERLTKFDPRLARLVELRFFAGLTVEETGEILGISPATVKRELTAAKAWLSREMGKEDQR